MDFEAVNWDVGNEASALDNSLFKKNKKKKQKLSLKRGKEEKEAMHIDDNINKKRKLSNEEKDNIVEPKGGVHLSEVSNCASLSRKEKRDRKWQEKILKRKQLGDTKDLNASNVDSKQVSKVPEKQPTNSKTSEMEGASPMSRTEKRKAKWDMMQEKKKLRLEHDKTGKQSKAKIESNQNDTSNTGTANGREKVNAEGQMNRKERKKLLWKQKLKERKLSQKNEKENEIQSDNEKKLQKDEPIAKNDMNSKNQSAVKQSNKSKKRKHGEGEKHTKNDASKQLHSPNKMDLEGKRENDDIDKVTDGKEKMTKRKRVCKKNKFKGYVKPEKDLQKELEAGEKSIDVKEDQNKTKETANIEISNAVNNVNSNKSKKLNNNMKKKKGNSKNNPKVSNDGAATAVEVRKDTIPKVSDNKGLKKNSGKTVMKNEGKKVSLDRNVLKKMLSPGAGKKILDDSIDAEENDLDEKGTEDDGDFKRKKEGNDMKGKTLLEKSRERLNAARFRYLNEQLYTTTGQEALKMFRKDDVAFSVYHEGFQSQVEKWPTNPIDVIIEKIQLKPKHLILADFGCGDAKLARSVPNKVHSFDLVALNDHVTVCDISKVPIKDSTVDIAVFCLSLMGTNLTSYLKEANRILKNNGTLMIAEVSSRFHSVGSFVLKVEKIGFKIKNQDAANKMFVMMEFKKTADCKSKTVEEIELKPCIYKKR